MTRIFLNNTVLYAAGEKADEFPLHEICKGREGTSDFDTLGYAHDEPDANRFAASHDMLELLVTIEQSGFLNESEGDNSGGHLLADARAVIRKARGQQ